jgi:tetratricopeptide (TPR) repeat protein
VTKSIIVVCILAGVYHLSTLAVVHAQGFTQLEDQLFNDIKDSRLDHFTLPEAAFILSGVTTQDSLDFYLQWYHDLVNTVKGFNLEEFDRIGSAEKVFNYLRTTLYDNYRLESTTLRDIVRNREYNCVSATILYNLVCEEFGWSTEAFETPTHVYTIFTDLGKELMVENTHPMGFNILQNLHAYSQYLTEFYQSDQVASIGLDRLYAYENSKGRVIDNVELLGCLAYNQAYFAAQTKNYARAYNLVLIAQDFNEDSRSNVTFEIGLYYRWGKYTYEKGRFDEAFGIFADGFYRYPDNKDFRQNTRAAFFRTLEVNRRKNNWSESRRVITEMFELEILNSTDQGYLQNLLQNWRAHAILRHEDGVVKEIDGIMDAVKKYGDSGG